MQDVEQVNLGRTTTSTHSTRPEAGPPHPFEPALARRISRRLFDVVLASVALVVFAPLMAVIAVAVRASGPGPVIYRSKRHAQGGGWFEMLKFRTMVDGVRQAELLASDPTARRQLAAEFKAEHDPRVTKVGRFLRRTSLDELPQFLNVLTGEMSIVGPRPKLDGEGDRYGELFGLVLSVRPGITGSWQTSGRNDLPFERRIDLDVEYVVDNTLATDIKICALTVRQMLTPKRFGAC